MLFRIAERIMRNKSLLHKNFSIYTTLHRPNNYKELLESDREYNAFTENYFNLKHCYKCYVIQPFIKWGPRKQHDFTSDDQLDEAKALINTLPSWSVADTITIPLLNVDKKYLFGTGNIDKLKDIVRSNKDIEAVFINLGALKLVQIANLEKIFGVPVLDRYRIVIQILKIHAKSKHAKIQVAMAEMHYFQRNVQHLINTSDKYKLMFQQREQKLKSALINLRKERMLLRQNREKNNFPVIAVVGYTNAGKTSLIKSLTGDDLQPKDKLFATLDVTIHSGLLPSGMEVLYVDTVGFISNTPKNLIECFIATLEDALLADVILHVEDISSSSYQFKKNHVLNTLKELEKQIDMKKISDKIVSVGNKCDLIAVNGDVDVLKVSAKTEQGLDALRFQLESKIISTTDRIVITVQLPSGGDGMRWLYKNATVISETPVPQTNNLVQAVIIMAHSKLQQFKHHYLT